MKTKFDNIIDLSAQSKKSETIILLCKSMCKLFCLIKYINVIKNINPSIFSFLWCFFYWHDYTYIHRKILLSVVFPWHYYCSFILLLFLLKIILSLRGGGVLKMICFHLSHVLGSPLLVAMFYKWEKSGLREIRKIH